MIALALLVAAPAFSGAAAFRHLEALVGMGPRVPGTMAHEQAQAYLERTFRRAGGRVEVERFHVPVEGHELALANVTASFGRGGPPVMIAAHWDSRPRSEQDSHPEHRALPTPGANDGASGTSVLLELARVLGAAAPAHEVRLVALDGEDWGTGIPTMFLGSCAYVARHRRDLPGWGVLLDMVGRPDSEIPREGFSDERARALTDRIYQTARAMHLESAFPDRLGAPIYDDHISFLDAGVPCVDLIGFDDPAWHTVHDLPGNCAPIALERVGHLVCRLLGISS